MSWTSSSMVESSSSLFFWTPWVNYTSAQHLDSLASLEKPFYWWCKLKFKRGTGQWLVGESHRDVCIKRTLFFLLCCESFCRWSKNSVENSLCLSACFVWDDINGLVWSEDNFCKALLFKWDLFVSHNYKVLIQQFFFSFFKLPLPLLLETFSLILRIINCDPGKVHLKVLVAYWELGQHALIFKVYYTV